jgi:hypothetical protein
MPNYPSLQEQDPTEPLDLSNLNFSMGSRFEAARKNSYEHYTLNEMVNNLANAKPDIRVPSSMPITEEDQKTFTADRPGLKIPLGVPKFVGGLMTSMYDNDKYLGLVSQAQPKNMGRFSAFGAWASGFAGSTFGSAANPYAWITGFGVGGVGKMAATSIAERAIGALGTREIYGSASARIGTLLAQGAGEGAGFGAGMQAATEKSEQEKRGILQQPHEYIQSLQNIGEGGLFGAMFGLGGRAIGLGLVGRPVTRLPTGEVLEHGAATGIPESGLNADGTPFIEGATVERQGGLLNRPEFKGISQTAKDYIGKIYKPWSKDADIVMKEEATGQMLNGHGIPDVGVTMKQGMVDEGENFRQGARDSGVDLEELDRSLAEAQENITSEMFSEHFAEKFEKAAEDRATYFRGEHPLGSAGYMAMPKADDAILGKGHWYSTNKDVAESFGSQVSEAAGQYKILDTSNIQEPHIKQLYDDATREAKRFYTDPESVRDTRRAFDKELKQKRKQFLDAAKDAGYEGISRRFDTPDNAALHGKDEVMFFNKPKSVEQIAKADKQKRMDELASQYLLAQSMRDHINDTHEPLTQADLRDYSENLKSPGMPDNGYTTDTPEGLSVDDYLNEFSDKQIQEMAEKFGNDKEIVGELRATQEKINRQPTFVEMTKNMTDCILKGGV